MHSLPPRRSLSTALALAVAMAQARPALATTMTLHKLQEPTPTPLLGLAGVSRVSDKLVTADSTSSVAPSYTEFVASRNRVYGASRRRP